MSESLRALFESLAKALVLYRPGSALDPLVSDLQSILRDGGAGSSLRRECEVLLDSIPDASDPVATGAFLDRVEQLVISTNRPPEAEQSQAQQEEASGRDTEMIELFLSSLQEHIRVVESHLLEMDGGDHSDYRLPEIRRSLHTIKGECGVLALEEAQGLLHVAESMIDRAEEKGAQLPLQLLFELVDWLGKLRGHLISCGAGCPEGAGELQAQFEGFGNGTPPLEVASSVEAEAPILPEAAPQPDVAPDPEPSPIEEVSLQPAAPPASEPASEEVQEEGEDQPVQFPAEIFEDETLQDFLVESEQHLEDAEGGLLALEALPEDPEPLNVVFRAFHTIKGVAGFLNIEPIVRLAHVTETLLDQGRKGERLLSSRDVGLFLTSKDAMSRLLGALGGGVAPGVRELDKLVGLLEAALRGEDVEPEQAANPVEALLTSVGLETKEELEQACSTPEKTVRRIGEVLVEQTSLSMEDLSFALQRQEKLAKSGTSIRIGELLVQLGLIKAEELEAALSGSKAPVAAKQLLETKTKANPIEPEAAKRLRVDPTVMVTTRRLDVLVDMVGELVIAQQMIQQDPHLRSVNSGTLDRNLAQVQKITRDLQEASMSLRMVTFKSTFQKMNRLSRDVSAKSGKNVQLILTGSDTEVDRTVVEKISDPLVHILRNAIDHGLESPQERIAAGKPERGTVELRALHRGGAIVIEVADDGKGMSRKKILDKAVQVGLMSDPSKADEWSDGEVFKLIFAPGFSTAEKVTDISGRGVGMDVVRKNIEGMRGKIEIDSVEGKGSTFTLRLPLTLAIIDGMVVRLGEDRYVIPTLSIVQSFQTTQDEVHRTLGRGEMIDVRGKLVPVVPLTQCLEEGNGIRFHDGEGVLILLESGSDQLCVAVDEIVGQQQVVIKNLGKSLPNLPTVSGGAILGDGRVAVILDVERLVQSQLVAA